MNENDEKEGQQQLAAAAADIQPKSDFYFIKANDTNSIMSKLKKMITDNIPKLLHCDPKRDIQILTPMNKGALGTQNINKQLQQLLNTHSGANINRFGMLFSDS